MTPMKIALLLGLALTWATQAQAAAAPAPAAGDWRRPDPENVVIVTTNQGPIIIELTPELAPLAVERVKQLVHAHFYDGQTFFRVIGDFMDQTGDPQNNGQGGSSFPDLKGEFTFRLAPSSAFKAVAHGPGVDLGFIGAMPVAGQPSAMSALTADGKVEAYGLFCPGVIGMARTSEPDTANSQFFIMRQYHQSLDRNYATIGRVIVGLNVARAIKTGEPPAPPQDRMVSVQMLSDIPAAQRPPLQVLDTRSAYFAALAAQTRASKGDEFTLCDIEVPAVSR
jgi:peptidylprolyl isomerase